MHASILAGEAVSFQLRLCFHTKTKLDISLPGSITYILFQIITVRLEIVI